ncbi:PhnA domain-containing protein [Sinirhodobacter sp. WL0062]|uniref:PhnA domain-containing protein n=1 Tax=Rhodobacter flavimaris TaxID=2907145 RepID=A0ABS8Z1E8_9RHOB|nr:alkylphosphonate utilization protein [Sinirhodobacter sp. WL0062]MCE5973760.1 PhnA domain-containing protein [Sinirhodobacter sp. WL0062]
MALIDDLMARSGGVCEFCGAAEDLAAEPLAGTEEHVLLCATCRSDEAPEAHWRCLEGAAWSAEPAVQAAVWCKLGQIEAAWAAEAREGMTLEGEAQSLAQAGQALPGVEHRDSNGALLANGDTVTLIKDLPVKGAGFTAKRGTAVHGISLVPDNAAHIEGRVEGQRIVILTEFVKKR